MTRHATVLAAALLAALATSARGQQPDSTRFEPAIRMFEAADSASAPPSNAVLFVGSSSIRLWCNLERDFPTLTVLNRGFGGSETSDLLHYVDRVVVRYHPRAIVLYEGDNDLQAGKSAPHVEADLDRLFAIVHERLPGTPIYVLSVKPSPSRARLLPAMRAVNAHVADEARRDPLLHYVDVFTPMLGRDGQPDADLFGADMLHMNSTGYALWRSVVGKALGTK